MGLSFVFAPVPVGEYYLTFEIEDTQGNRYCSDFLPIESDGGVIEEPTKPDPISVDWETGDKVTLAEKDGVSLFFTTVEDSAGVKAYTVGAVNKTDKEIYVNCKDLYINGNVYVNDYLGVFTVASGQTATYEYGIDLGACAELGISDDLQSLSFTATVETNAERKLIFYEQGISVNFSDETRIIYQPDFFSFKFAPTAAVFRSFMAEKQVVYEDADVKVWLLSLGGQKDFTDEYSPNLYGALCYENLSDRIINICVTGLVFDDTYVPLSSSVISIPGNCKYYSTICVLEEELNQAGISSASKIQLLIKRTAFNTLEGGGGFAQLDWCDVKLSAFGAATDLQHGDTVIYDSNGIKISLLSIEGDRWNLCIENNRDEAVYVGITDTIVDGKEVYDGTEDYFGLADSSLGANQKCFAYAYYGNWNDWNATCNKAEFKIKVLDFAEEKVLFTDNTVITLTKDMK